MDAIHPAELHELTPKGELSRRLIRSIQHLSLIPEKRLTDDLAHHQRPWSYGADFAGRWIEVLSVASSVPFLAPLVPDVYRAVDALVGYQSPDGMLGFREDSTTWACAARGLRGFVEAYAHTGYEPALDAATRLVQRFDTSFPERPTQRACMGLGDLVRYSEVTGDDLGIDVACRMYDTCYELGPDAPFDAIFGNYHIFLNVHRGLVALSCATGNSEYLEQAIALKDWSAETHEWPSGGIPEWLTPPSSDDPRYTGNEDALFFEPVANPALIRDESCTTGDWMLLNLEIAAATGDPTLVEHAEWIFWNHFLSGQAVDGGWCGHGNCSGMAGEVWDFCCSHHGPRCLIEMLRYGVVDYRDGILINLYLPVERYFSVPGSSGKIAVEFDPTKDKCTIRFGNDTRGTFPIYLRKPGWASSVTIRPSAGTIRETDESIMITHSWSASDTIEIAIPPRIEIMPASDPGESDSFSLKMGTIMLAGVSPPFQPDGVGEDEIALTGDSGFANQAVVMDQVIVDSVWSARIRLERRFKTGVGLFWVDPVYADWNDPQRGYRFVFDADGPTVAGDRSSVVQGYQGTQVLGIELTDVDELLVRVWPTDKHLSFDHAHFETLTLFDGSGNVVPVKLEVGYESTEPQPCRGISWSVDEANLREDLKRHAGRVEWPYRCEPDGPYLVPFKDLQRTPRPETIVGARGAIQSFDFSLNFRRQ